MTTMTAVQEVRADQLRVGDKLGLHLRNTITKVILHEGRVYLGLAVDNGYSLYDCDAHNKFTIRARAGYKAEDVTFVEEPNLIRAEQVKIGDHIYHEGWEVTDVTTTRDLTSITTVSKEGVTDTTTDRSNRLIRIQEV